MNLYLSVSESKCTVHHLAYLSEYKVSVMLNNLECLPSRLINSLYTAGTENDKSLSPV